METEEKKNDLENDVDDFILKKEWDELEQCDDKRNIFIQYRTQYNYGIVTGDSANIENIQFNDNKGRKCKQIDNGNILKDEKMLIDWITKYNETYSMAMILAVAVFNGLSYMWIVEAADVLYSSFDKINSTEESRLAISDILKPFDAEICQGEINTYTGKTQVNIIRLSKIEYQEKILKCIWRECPRIHENIVVWLKNYNMKTPVLRAKIALDIMGIIASWDYYYFSHDMIGMLQRDKNISTDILIARIIIVISSQMKNASNIENLLIKWSNTRNVHYNLTNLIACVELSNKISILQSTIEFYIDETMEGIRLHKDNEYLKNLFDFYASGVRTFTFYRILIDKIYKLSVSKTTTIEKRKVCELFLRLFAIDINLTRFEEEKPIFIELCVRNSIVKNKICFLWQLVWECRYYRKIFYNLLTGYNLKNKKNVNELRCFVESAFGAICSPEILEDICNKVQRGCENE